MSELLESGESIIWSGKPKRQAYFLPAFAGIPFALFFSIFLYIMLTILKPSGIEEMFLPIFMSCWIIGLIVVPPVWRARRRRFQRRALFNFLYQILGSLEI
jgi:hypothetical protein